MTRLNISFNSRVPFPILMTLLPVLSIFRLFGISVTLAPPSLSDLDPSRLLSTLPSNLTDEAKRALDLATLGANNAITNLAPAALTDEAKAALARANIDPATAIASLAPILTADASAILSQAHIDPSAAITHLKPALSLDLATLGANNAVTNLAPAALTDEAKAALARANIDPAAAIASLAPTLTDDASAILSQAHIDPSAAITHLKPALSLDISKALDPISVPALGPAFQAPDGLAGPLEAEALKALAHATSESLAGNALPDLSLAGQAGWAKPGAATTAMHNDISAQVSKGNLSKEGALAAHAALYNVVAPKFPKFGM